MPRQALISFLPSDWRVLAFVEEPKFGRVIRIDEKTNADGTKEQRRVDVTRDRKHG